MYSYVCVHMYKKNLQSDFKKKEADFYDQKLLKYFKN